EHFSIEFKRHCIVAAHADRFSIGVDNGFDAAHYVDAGIGAGDGGYECERECGGGADDGCESILQVAAAVTIGPFGTRSGADWQSAGGRRFTTLRRCCSAPNGIRRNSRLAARATSVCAVYHPSDFSISLLVVIGY